jgi:hypothetical protein
MSDIVLLDAAWDGVAADVEALLDSWAVGVGVAVVKGQTLATVVLVKASIDIEAPCQWALECHLCESRRIVCCWQGVGSVSSGWMKGFSIALVIEQTASVRRQVAQRQKNIALF